MNIHAILPRSKANGPGTRTAIWLQGCSLKCPGCFNPDTHSTCPKILMSAQELFAVVLSAGPDVEGVTISGGEPMDQASELLEFLELVRSRTGLSAILLSGYTRDEILRIPQSEPIMALIDVLISGRYLQDRTVSAALRGSANKEVFFLTVTYDARDLECLPDSEIEIDRAGNITVSGIRVPW